MKRIISELRKYKEDLPNLIVAGMQGLRRRIRSDLIETVKIMNGHYISLLIAIYFSLMKVVKRTWSEI